MEASPFPFGDMDLFDTIPPWWESKTGQVRNWLDLPQEITLHILKKVGVLDILRNVQMVCSAWRDLSKEPCLFTRIILKYIKVDGMSLLHLRRAKRLPQLEHLDLSGAFPFPSLLMEMIQEVGCWCPNLKRLRLHFVYDYEDDIQDPRFYGDGVAFAIANYMPHLRSFLLINNTLGNEGLQAILEGCPELEYIGLRLCPYIDIHDWLCYCSIFRNKIIDTKVYSEAKGNLDCYLRTKD